MSDELIQIKPSEVHFVEELRRSKRGAIFRVMVRGRHCAMKVVSYCMKCKNSLAGGPLLSFMPLSLDSVDPITQRLIAQHFLSSRSGLPTLIPDGLCRLWSKLPTILGAGQKPACTAALCILKHQRCPHGVFAVAIRIAPNVITI
jgi:hypothetical protein